jgi:hypothetical protein
MDIILRVRNFLFVDRKLRDGAYVILRRALMKYLNVNYGQMIRQEVESVARRN